jgi:hypothetical protein
LPERHLRLLGFVPLASFLAQLHYVCGQGRVLQILWVCHMANLFLAAGLFLRSAQAGSRVWRVTDAFIRVATLWLVIGLPLWLKDLGAEGPPNVETVLTHVAGLACGLWALSRIRASRETWWQAFAAYLVLQTLCRFVTPESLNVNIAHGPYGVWERSYLEYWLLTTVLSVVVLWVVGVGLCRVFPPSAPD